MLAGDVEVAFAGVVLAGGGEVGLPPISLRAHHRTHRSLLVRVDADALQ
ncbi:hypothetical protein AB0D86_46670 [Streptomyces sp. NPDC048324]